MNWKDVLHYGTAIGLLAAAALAPIINATVPGVHIDPSVATAAAVGIFAGGFKGGAVSK